MQPIPLFPLRGAILFPELHLPLHIFEPRFRAMVEDAAHGDKRIGIIQPRGERSIKRARAPDRAALFRVGCIGKIVEASLLDDGAFHVVLEGESRFTLINEPEVTTPYRQGEVVLIDEDMAAYLSSIERAALEGEAHRFADLQGYSVDWEAVSRLDDRALVNGVSQIAPFDPASKQALLEAGSLSSRCELLMQLMQFFSHHDGGEDEAPATMQ